MNREETATYAIIALAIGLLAYSAMSMTIGSKPQSGSGGVLVDNPQNFQYYQQQAQQSGSECGDLNDPSNLQHLSHHPSQFQSCYRIVDPAKFKAAVGRDVNEFIR